MKFKIDDIVVCSAPLLPFDSEDIKYKVCGGEELDDGVIYAIKEIGNESAELLYVHECWLVPANKPDNVNHPKHYESSCSLECIDVMEIAFGYEAAFEFCICNAFKYLWRYQNKNGAEDLKKAEWYLNRAENYIHNKYSLSENLGKLRELRNTLDKHKKF